MAFLAIIARGAQGNALRLSKICHQSSSLSITSSHISLYIPICTATHPRAPQASFFRGSGGGGARLIYPHPRPGWCLHALPSIPSPLPYPAIFPAVFHFHRHTPKTPARARSRLGVVGWQKTPYPPRVRGISRPPGTGCGAGGGPRLRLGLRKAGGWRARRKRRQICAPERPFIIFFRLFFLYSQENYLRFLRFLRNRKAQKCRFTVQAYIHSKE